MKNQNLEINLSAVENNCTTMDTITETPFSATFKYSGERITVQLVNAGDVLKLASVFADMLKKNDIDCTITKSKQTKEE